MALIDCKECGRQISDSAAKCPHCGAPNSAKKASPMYRLALVLVVVVGLLIAAGIIYSQISNPQADETDRNTNEIEKLVK